MGTATPTRGSDARFLLRVGIWVGVAVALLLVGRLFLRMVARPSLGDDTWARIGREGVLRVGMDASYPPFGLVDDAGHFSGFDVDLGIELALRWGVTPQFTNLHFDALYDALKTGKFDLIISALPYDRTMTRDVLYSQSYFDAGQVLLARRDNVHLQSFADLAGGSVSVELGSEAHQLVRQLSRDRGLSVEVVAQRDWDAAAALLIDGKVDALVCDMVTARALLKRGEELRLVGPTLTDEPYVIAARHDSPVLMAEVNAALQEWRRNGLLESLQRRWF